jgi:cytosine/uracil/thiamine/allantoin permease
MTNTSLANENLRLDTTLKSSPLYSDDLAPIPLSNRTWNKWNLAALWVGMAVCIPTYILASYMIKTGLSWQAALIIIGLANAVITIPMVLNGHAGVKYGIPFPVVGRAAFGHRGVHIPSFLRAIVACGWFGVQTWIGGLALYSIWNAATGASASVGLDAGKFIGFGIFWLINIYFIWKGTESIRWLEDWSAPILILIGFLLIGWGVKEGGGFKKVLTQSKQLERPTASYSPNTKNVTLNYLRQSNESPKATKVNMWVPLVKGGDLELGWIDITWIFLDPEMATPRLVNLGKVLEPVDFLSIENGERTIKVQVKNQETTSSAVNATVEKPSKTANIWSYILWFTAMVGFWATMSISISDITRFAKSQDDQIKGQFIGLPGTMIFYSFVGIFVTCAAVVVFNDVLVAEDAPWDPVSLVAKFKSPMVVIFAQIAMIIATLSTNIAANVIAPAYAFSNMFPKTISFKMGGVIAGIIGILICPWWLMDEISNLLLFVSGLLGPILGILLCDYFIIRHKTLNINGLFEMDGEYSYRAGFNPCALIAMVLGVLAALIGKWIPILDFLFSLSWFTGFVVAFGIYYFLMRKQ